MTRILLLLVVIALASCSEKPDARLTAMLSEMRTAYAEGRDSACLVAVDSLRSQFAKSVDVRREALAFHQKASLRIAQGELARVDTALEAAKRDYDYLYRRVAALHEKGEATASQLTAVTLSRLRRDSLQVRFDVLCAKIRYIHRRQKQL